MLLIIMVLAANVVSYGANAKDKFNINFTQMPLNEAFRNLAEMTKMNIATDSRVQGTVTLYLHDVTFYEALDALTRTHGLDYKVIKDTVYIAPQEDMKSNYEQMKTQIFKLENAEPDKIQANIEHLVEEGTIKINERTNSLIITTYKSNLKEVAKAIKDLDYSRQQVSLQVRFEEISHSKMEELGIDWKLGSEEGIDIDSNSDASDFQIGDLSFGYQASLNALENNGAATVIANPKITTMAGEKAHINIGDEIPIIKTETTEEDDGDTETTTEVEYRNVGIDLNILPKVRKNNKIMINLQPEITTFVDWVEVGQNRYPKTSVKTVETKVEVKNGQTIAIGGLIKETTFENMSKVPLLGDMPVLGRLFTREKTEKEKRELVIFITPKIIDLDEEKPVKDTKENKTKSKPESKGKDSKQESQNQRAKTSSAEQITNYQSPPQSPKLLFVSQLLENQKQVTKSHVLQLGAFENKENAKQIFVQLKANNFQPILLKKKLYKVQLGPFAIKTKANKVASKLKKHNFQFYHKTIYIEKTQQL